MERRLWSEFDGVDDWVDLGDILNDLYMPTTIQVSFNLDGEYSPLIQTDNGLATVLKDELQGRQNLLEPVYKNGQLLREHTFSDIRLRVG